MDGDDEEGKDILAIFMPLSVRLEEVVVLVEMKGY